MMYICIFHTLINRKHILLLNIYYFYKPMPQMYLKGYNTLCNLKTRCIAEYDKIDRFLCKYIHLQTF